MAIEDCWGFVDVVSVAATRPFARFWRIVSTDKSFAVSIEYLGSLLLWILTFVQCVEKTTSDTVTVDGGYVDDVLSFG